MASPASAEPPRAVKRLPRPSEMCRRVPFSTARPTARFKRSYASIERGRPPADLRRRNVKIHNKQRGNHENAQRKHFMPPRADNRANACVSSSSSSMWAIERIFLACPEKAD
jgi:hypothetical protein